MVIVNVEHYLNRKGRGYFSEWVNSVREKIIAYEGFISIKQLIDINDESRTLVEVKFESLDLLKHWATCEEHDKMINDLVKYSVKKYHSQIFKYAS